MNESEELTWEEQNELADMKCKERIRQIVSDLFNELNKMGNEQKLGEFVIDAIRYQHRTLQQNYFGHVILPSIMDFAKRYDEDNFDLRNEMSCRLAKKIEPVIKDAHLPFI